mmetsp:Transcript_55109/g.124038  ORF Transcript_55109/g.124038 Transcript_55109/m.124038 type:complete len:546 (+) Transcript_55109:86-1723(+)
MGAIASAILGSFQQLAGSDAIRFPGHELEFLKGISRAWEAAARRGSRTKDMNYPVPEFLSKSGYERNVNVAITGNGGVGKSLFINTVRGIKPSDPHWAPVGVRETTTEPVWYAYPGESRVRLWDMEGACLSEVPRGSTRDEIGVELDLQPEWSTVEHYIRTIGLRYFDVVLVLSSSRLTETEIELAQELHKHEVPFYYVRTKLDWDIDNSEADYGMSSEETIKSIREELHQNDVADPYLINARQLEDHDFPKLLKDVLLQVGSRWPELMEGDTSGGNAVPEDASELAIPDFKAAGCGEDGMLALPRPGAQPVEAFHWYTGRWAWSKDDKFYDYIKSEIGEMAASFAVMLLSSPEHTFRLMGDGRLQVKIVQGTSLSGGNFGCIDTTGEWSPEVEMSFFGSGLVGRGRELAIGGCSLVVEFKGQVKLDARHPMHFRIIREVIGDTYILSFENCVKGIMGHRYFKRWPWYRIENETGEKVTMQHWTTWSLMSAALTQEVKPGMKYVCTSGKETTSEKLVLKLPNGKSFKVDQAKAESTIVLKTEDFS